MCDLLGVMPSRISWIGIVFTMSPLRGWWHFEKSALCSCFCVSSWPERNNFTQITIFCFYLQMINLRTIYLFVFVFLTNHVLFVIKIVWHFLFSKKFSARQDRWSFHGHGTNSLRSSSFHTVLYQFQILLEEDIFRKNLLHFKPIQSNVYL